MINMIALEALDDEITELNLKITNGYELVEKADNILKVVDNQISVEELALKYDINENVACSDTAIALSLESLKLAHNILGFPFDEKKLSLEENNLATSLEEKSYFIESMQNVIKDTYNHLVSLVKTLVDKVVMSNTVMTNITNTMYENVNNLDDRIDINVKFNNDEMLSIQDRFTTLISLLKTVKTNEDLYKALISAEASITKPKSTAAMSNIIQTIIPRADVDQIMFSDNVIDKDMKPGIGINRKLNNYFFTKLPTEYQNKTSDKHIAVVEFSNNKCGGWVLAGTVTKYDTGTLTIKTNDHVDFDRPLDKQHMLNLVALVKRLTIHLQGFKEQVSNDIQAGYKVLHSLNNIDRINNGDSDKKVLGYNMDLIEHHTKVVPKVSHGNISNYYSFLRNILWYVRLNYKKIAHENNTHMQVS